MFNKKDWLYKKFFCRASIKSLGKITQSIMAHEAKVHCMKRFSTHRAGYIILIHKSKINSFEELNEIVLINPDWDEILRAELLNLELP